MTRRPTREEAARALGVTLSADPDTCKRAYRRLVREHHPDVGGDPQRFHDLHQAYERLIGDRDAPPEPSVSRGTPSRPPVRVSDEHEVGDLGGIDWEVTLPRGPLNLDRNRVVTWLADTTSGMVRPLGATSRAPGSRVNGVAHLLSPELTSRLSVRDTVDDLGRPIVALEVVGRPRRARRALDRVTVQGGWVRTRHSTTTRLHFTLGGAPDPRLTAVRATRRLEGLLDQLGWPLEAWTLDRP